MNPHITVIGATGRVGALVTREALRRDATVTAFVRDPARLPADLTAHPGLTVITGEIDDPVAMSRAVTGSAATIVTVGVRYRKGHPWGGIAGRADVVPAAMRTLLTVAEPATHVVLLSAFGAAESWRQLPGIARLIISTSALRVSYAGLTEAENLLARSGLPYTVVRAVTLTDTPATGNSVDATGRRLRGNPKVARPDLARMLVDAALGGVGESVAPAGPGRVLVAAAT